jgi:LysM repeat protein
MKRLLPVVVVVVMLAGILALPVSAGSPPPTVTYTVQPGDTLASISRQFCTTWQQIYNLNRAIIGPNPDSVKPGMVLQVPNQCSGQPMPCGGQAAPCGGQPTPSPCGGQAAPCGGQPTPRPCGGQAAPCGGQPQPCSVYDRGPSLHARGPIQGNIYSVMLGDTTFSISRRFGLTVDQLSAANGLPDPSRIYAGQKLVIPGLGPCPPPPAKPFITISSPTSGAQLPPTFTVTGTGGGLFEGSLVVRAMNNAGQVLAEMPTTLQGTDVGAGGTGTYSVQLTVNVSANTPGKIVASATSPKDGSIVAAATVPVTFNAGTSQPFITISSPASDAQLPATFTVSGTGGGLFEGSLVIRAMNNAGQVLAEVPATLQGANVGAGGTGTYSVQMTVHASANTPGKILAFSTSPKDGRIVASASVPVNFNAGASQPFITISSPASGAQLPATFTVSGTGGGLFEGSLVVRAQTNAGQILAQQPTTLQGANVGAGGTGTYSVQLTVNVSANTAGKIVAFSTSPKDGSLVASANVPVTFTSSSSPTYKDYAPGQCKIRGKPGAPFYAFPGGPQIGYFGAGGTFNAIRGAKVSGAYWYLISTDPGSGTPSVWVPSSSTTAASAGCAF